MYNEAQDLPNDGAYAHIIGNLGKNIEIKKSKNGSDYGVLTVLTNKPGDKPKPFKVLVFNQRLIKQQAKDLLEGVRVWTVGEMKIPESLIAKETGSQEDVYPDVNCLTIDIGNDRGITILESLAEQRFKQRNLLHAN